MGKTNVIVDTGLLVGYFNRRDAHHTWSKDQLSRVGPPLHTCEAVLSETVHLLEGTDRGIRSLLTFLQRGAVTVSFSYPVHADDIQDLLRRYADQPMSSADACLVAMSEEWNDSCIVTTDNDFRRYRTTDGEPLDVRLLDGNR